MEDRSEGFCVRVAEHHKLVAREGFVKVKLVRGCLVANELLVSKRKLWSWIILAEDVHERWDLLPGELFDHVPQRKNDTVNELGFLVERKTGGLASPARRLPSSSSR